MGNLSDHFAGGGGGNVLEYFSYQPDGRVLTTTKGDITVPNLTTYQHIDTTTYTDVTGSVISYTPPDDTKYVEYRWITQACYKDSYLLPHYYVELDGIAVNCTRKTNYENSTNRDTQLQTGCTIQILGSGSDDIANGKVATWTSDRTFKIKARSYSTSYGYSLDRLYHWNGAGSYQNLKPEMLIVAFR